MAKIHLGENFSKKKVVELREKLSSPEYVKKAIDKIALELTHLLFKDNGY
ncbi:MAG: hypothetical protein KKH98_05570 [Spirochaetes bacterium]|nr:hypothetical protein [Spirochaetota bacterium]